MITLVTSAKRAIQSLYLGLVLLLIILSIRAHASNCTVQSSIPTKQQQIGTGSATAGSDGVTTVNGDQAIYVKLKNANILGVSYTVTIARNSTPTDVICSYTAILPPQGSVILSGAVFAPPPIGWKITVSVGDESDAGVLAYGVFSLPQPAKANRPKSPNI
jgi:hypothetical protein